MARKSSKMRIIVSTVSHDHQAMIFELNALAQFAHHDDIIVICRDNKPDCQLEDYCEKNNIIYIANDKQYGFAKNNNLNFLFYKKNLSPKCDDFFLLLNPDVQITTDTIDNLKKYLMEKSKAIIAGNLFLDESLSVTDDNIRRYPKLYQFAKTYLLGDRSTMISRNAGLPEDGRFWASGAFLVINASLYEQLNGLDESYYMYCEDIDFCCRAAKANIPVVLAEEVKAIHWRQRASKKILSQFFVWHVMSVLKYCFIKKKIKANKSLLRIENNKNRDYLFKDKISFEKKKDSPLVVTSDVVDS